ncbi:MAG: hypothetical protein IPK98_11325 [Chloracidobacterium sp.]|nr:hypothetical protein [Chloracidobacterium sp.]
MLRIASLRAHRIVINRLAEVITFLFVHRSDLTYDGDGHAIKSQEGNRPGIGTLTMGDPTYQLWSSVLNSAVTEVYNNGAKKTTKVFAGGAVIAEQNTFEDRRSFGYLPTLYRAARSG